MQLVQILVLIIPKKHVTPPTWWAGRKSSSATLNFLIRFNDLSSPCSPSKSSAITNPLQHHIHTLGSMQPGSVEFVSRVLPSSTHSYSPTSAEQAPLESSTLYKTNTTVSSSSSSGYESVLSRSSKSHRSFFSRLKRLINFPSNKKSSDYQVASINQHNESSHSPNSSTVTMKNPASSSATYSNGTLANDYRRNSLTRLDIRRKSGRRTLTPASQHIPFLYGLKNCGNTW